MLEHALANKHGHLPSASTSIKSLATAVSDLQHILKRVQREDQEQRPSNAPGKTDQNMP